MSLPGSDPSLIEHSQDLFRGDDPHAKHQMGIDLVMPADSHLASTVLVLQRAIDPFRLTADLVTFGFMRQKRDLLAAPGLWSISGR